MERKKLSVGGAKVSKTLVRDFEVKVPKNSKNCHKTVIVHKEVPKTKGILKKTTSADIPLSEPTKNTISRLEQKIERVSKVEPIILNPTNAEVVRINKKVGNKLNFHFDESVYKDLIALNIDGRSGSMSGSRSHRKLVPAAAKKDIEPNLNDFYENKRTSDRPTLVSAPKIKFPSVYHYDKSDVFRKFKSWEQ